MCIRDRFSAKYYLLAISCALLFLVCLPYAFLNGQLILFSFVMMLINMSFSIFAYMLLASVNSLRVDPNEGSAFSLSGFGIAHYLIAIPLMVVPCLLYWLGTIVGGKAGGLLLLGMVGLLGVLFHRQLIQWCVDIFKKNRYKIGAAFRKTQ